MACLLCAAANRDGRHTNEKQDSRADASKLHGQTEQYLACFSKGTFGFDVKLHGCVDRQHIANLAILATN